MVQYKLSYFPVRGLGEISRKILHYANIPFEDIRIPEEEWPKHKPNTPYGQMPVLEFDGKVLAQSFAIARFLARKYGFSGKGDWESAQIDSIADFTKDTHNKFRPYFLTILGWIPGNKEELYQTVFKPTVEKSMPVLEKLLKESSSGFFVNSGVSWVDFYVASVVETIEGLDPKIMTCYPEILNHKERVYALPQLKTYLESTPKTAF